MYYILFKYAIIQNNTTISTIYESEREKEIEYDCICAYVKKCKRTFIK